MGQPAAAMMRPARLALCGLAWQACLCGQAAAQPDSPESWTFKLTPSLYSNRNSPEARDLNLRANLGPHAVWVGQYRQAGFGEQTRTGYEYTASPAWGQVVYSLQAAERGFAGGAVTAQLGHTVYAIAGWGRTNLQPYYNLNFDPNDAITLGLGSVWQDHQVSLYRIQDDRLHTGQRVTHLLWRYHPGGTHRLTLDLANKRGRSDAQGPWLQGNSLSLTWDWDRYFVRAAIDHQVNFSEDTQQRLSVGVRF
jgi:hypothetical protein